MLPSGLRIRAALDFLPGLRGQGHPAALTGWLEAEQAELPTCTARKTTERCGPPATDFARRAKARSPPDAFGVCPRLKRWRALAVIPFPPAADPELRRGSEHFGLRGY
jgi:hypothetical protein